MFQYLEITQRMIKLLPLFCVCNRILIEYFHGANGFCRQSQDCSCCDHFDNGAALVKFTDHVGRGNLDILERNF